MKNRCQLFFKISVVAAVLNVAVIRLPTETRGSLLLPIAQQSSSTRNQRLQKYKESYNYLPPSAPSLNYDKAKVNLCGEPPDFAKYFRYNLRRRSRWGEDKTIYEQFFKGKMQGNETYLELGAFDGVSESNSRFFDVCLGWTGLLIEGMPHTFQRMVRNRPHAHRMNLAPSCSAEYEAANHSIRFFNVSKPTSGLPGLAMRHEGIPTVTVPCGPLGPILEDIFPNGRLDFFSLDVEGSELLVLDTIDFAKVSIPIIMIEVKNKFCTKRCLHRQEIRSKMQQLGYQRYEQLVTNSDVFVHPKSPYQLEDPSKQLVNNDYDT